MAVRQAPLHGDRAVGGQVVDEESLPHGGHASEGHFCTKKNPTTVILVITVKNTPINSVQGQFLVV